MKSELLLTMNTKRYQLENYRKHLLNRVTATPHIIEYIENCLATEDETARHSFHKIMIHNWVGSELSLFETLAEYFSPSCIPVNYTSQGAITSFYTSSLNLVLKIAKFDFMFPHQRNMFTIDILFNDKTSADCFENRITIEDIVAGVVSTRFSDKSELDLSNFCNDPEFVQKKVNFYKLNLLANFKILMLRMGRDTKSLNLSNNNLSTVPVDILNFFIKGDLIAINLSNNNIPSLQELHRVSSKIEKLWVEGNPLCEELDALSYVKQILVKFPRLNELDGIKLNDHGVPVPFFKNYVVTPDRRTKMVVDKFLSLYFHHYDWSRKNIDLFYDLNCHLTISTNFTEAAEAMPGMEAYANHSRNILHPKKRSFVVFNNKLYKNRDAVRVVHSLLPRTIHDPATFTVDVVLHNTKYLVLIVDGLYKTLDHERYFQFRRTFTFHVTPTRGPNIVMYYIIREVYTVSFATQSMIDKAFKCPLLHTNLMALHNPDKVDINTMVHIFTSIAKLKKKDAEARLRESGYDIQRALKALEADMKAKRVPETMILDEDDFSDSSSLIDDD